jgi:hypothetical protein
MTAAARAFSPDDVQLYIHPYRITGFKGDTSMTLAPVTADDEHEVSTDGITVTLNRSTDRRYILTLSMDPESIGYKRLAEIRAEQQAEEAGAIPKRAFRLRDPSNGDEVTSDYAIIISRPELALGSKREAVEVRILLPDPTIKLGEDLG